MKGTKNQIIITQSNIELHAKNKDIFIIGAEHYHYLQKAQKLSKHLNKHNNPAICSLNIMNGEVKQVYDR